MPNELLISQVQFLHDFKIMKINTFRSDLTDISAKKRPLFLTYWRKSGSLLRCELLVYNAMLGMEQSVVLDN